MSRFFGCEKGKGDTFLNAHEYRGELARNVNVDNMGLIN